MDAYHKWSFVIKVYLIEVLNSYAKYIYYDDYYDLFHLVDTTTP